MVIFRGGKFRENFGKTFHVGVIFTILLLFPSHLFFCLFLRGGNSREEDESAKNAKITHTRKNPRIQYHSPCQSMCARGNWILPPPPLFHPLEFALPIELCQSQKCTMFSIWLKTIPYLAFRCWCDLFVNAMRGMLLIRLTIFCMKMLYSARDRTPQGRRFEVKHKEVSLSSWQEA